ncbi:MAG: RNA-binding protein [Chloroflexi bacterium]|nr:RNA-binding protein [Chloroflexota bacterium]
MNLFVGNLAEDVTDDDLRTLFTTYGEVASATVLKDRYSGRSRGFGFVEMPNNAQAEAAINGLKGKDLKGKSLTVDQARPRSDTRGGPRGGDSGGYRGGGSRGGGGGRGSRY